LVPRLPPRPTIVDLGCGPGLFVQALSARYPQATLYSYDVTPAMIAYGQHLLYTGTRPTLAVHNVATQPLPLATGTVHLVCMTSVLHLFDDPFPGLSEVHRIMWLLKCVQAPLSHFLFRTSSTSSSP
jgi:trans-aconitate 2-methyltransferase